MQFSHKTFGKFVRQLRRQLDLTQAELGRRVGCATITIRKIEGDKLRPSVQIAERLALSLNVPTEEQAKFVRLARSASLDDPSPPSLPSPRVSLEEIGLEDLSGRAIRGYKLGEQIGKGGFGVVYQGFQPVVEREVAVKIILPEFANHPDFIRRFESEAQIVARLEHPYIVPLYDFWREPDLAFLVMRLLRGGNLKQKLKNERLTKEKAFPIIKQIGQALDAAHRLGIVHRDIKPANILLDEDENAYLADFGIAKNIGNLNVDENTTMGSIIGSHAYISPEQILSEPISPQTDIYSLGVMVYEILTGHQPFQGPSPGEYMRQHLNIPFPLIHEEQVGVPFKLNQVLIRATAKTREDRYENVNSFINDLSRMLAPSVSAYQPPSEPTEITSLPVSPFDLNQLNNPYRGLHPFTEADADNFFGRDTLVQEMLGKLSEEKDTSRFLAIVGPSGSGKSSAVKAGLIPAVRRGGLPNSETWFVVDMIPSSHPFEDLEASLLRVAMNPPSSLLAQLKEGERGVLRTVRRILPKEQNVELLLVVDQFEELFTLVKDEEIRQQFIEGLITAVLDPQSRLRVVITLRADFTHRPLGYPNLAQLMHQQTLFAIPLSADELEEAIDRPLHKLDIRLESGLMATIVQEVGNEPGMLPLLQYGLTELFERRSGNQLTLAAYQEMGGITGALTQRADEIFERLSRDAQETTRQLFMRLITLGDGIEDTRRRVLLMELEGLKDGGVGEIVDGFGQYRLLTFDHDPISRTPTVEVAHEALLREWLRLRDWLQESREDVRQQRQLAEAARLWNLAEKEESYLLRGGRLTTFSAWAEGSTITLTSDEQHYLLASTEAQEVREADEAVRQRRELETAEQLAQEQSQRAEEQSKAAATLRQRAYFLAAASVIAAILAGIAVMFSNQSARNAETAINNLSLAQEQRDIALANEQIAREAFSLSLAANARQALATNDSELALLLALAANDNETPPLAAWNTLLDVAYAPGGRWEEQVDFRPTAMDVHPNGQWIMLGDELGHLSLWNIVTKEEIRRFEGHTQQIGEILFHKDGDWVLTGSLDKSAILWDVHSGEIIQQFDGHSDLVSSLAFFRDKKRILTGVDSKGSPGELIVWQVEDGKKLQEFGGVLEENHEGVRSIALLPDDKRALVGLWSNNNTNPNTLLLWDIDNEEIDIVFNLDELVWSVAVSPNGRFGLAGTDDALIYVFNLESGELVDQWRGHDGTVVSLQMSSDGQTVISGGTDDKVIWWDFETGTPLNTLIGQKDNIIDVAFTNVRQVISTSIDGSVRLWDLSSHWELDRFNPFRDTMLVSSWQFTQNGDAVFTVRRNASTILMDYETGEGLPFRNFGQVLLTAFKFSENGRYLLGGNAIGTFTVYDLERPQETVQLFGHSNFIHSIDISRDGHYALSSSLDGQAIYWDLQNRQILRRLTGHIQDSGITHVRFLQNEQYAITSARDSSIILWDLETGTPIKQLTGIGSEVGSHLFSNEATANAAIVDLEVLPNDQIITAGEDQTLLLWDLETGQPIRRFIGHTATPYDVEIIPNSNRIISHDGTGTAILWDITTGNIIRRYQPESEQIESNFISSLVVHPSGNTALGNEAGGSYIKWQLTEPTPVELMEWIRSGRVLREFSCEERETFQIQPLCVNGVVDDSTEQLIARVAETTSTISQVQFETTAQMTEPLIFPEPSPVAPQVIQFGQEAFGELENQQSYDIWTFDGKEGDIVAIEIQSENPLHANETIPFEEQLSAGVLNPAIYLIAPDGVVVEKMNDFISLDQQILTDPKIAAVRLETDGIYSIWVKSHLSNTAGQYSIQLNKVEPLISNNDLRMYQGDFLEGPWESTFITQYRSGRLYLRGLTRIGERELLPIGEHTFALSSESNTTVRFTFDEAGNLTGYDILLALINTQDGGRWYRAEAIR